ncbi:hypothetical protein GALMADRAFT_144307 [Galerina marginata CBS 339.88]|uniref:RING-type domain-containing protein n=1 Tax=Galerina marginata (strain CBS 339.88) TaxID=685588 RepID=A0A067SVK8_GALM3|nr:hypothetical protein GALMADRAFT_144307 [Galerina marginata CBS 339.88]
MDTRLHTANIKEREIIDLTGEAPKSISHRYLEIDLSWIHMIFMCPVCKDLYKEPITLVECGHTFCRKCIFGWFSSILHANNDNALINNWDQIRPEKPYSCPMCRVGIECRPNTAFIIRQITAIIEDLTVIQEGSQPNIDEEFRDSMWEEFFPQT